MELINEFTVGVPLEQAWLVLTDVERIAPCMPGAQLTEIGGDEYRGTVKVKVGPITAQYKGAAIFVERDDAGHRAVLRAEGRDVRGQGNASATITAQLEPALEGTRVHLTTDLTVTGKVAQFGRGVLADVSAKLVQQFVTNLENDVLVGVGNDPTGPITIPARVETPDENSGPAESADAIPADAAPPLVLDEPGSSVAPADVLADNAAPVAPTPDEMAVVEEAPGHAEEPLPDDEPIVLPEESGIGESSLPDEPVGSDEPVVPEEASEAEGVPEFARASVPDDGMSAPAADEPVELFETQGPASAVVPSSSPAPGPSAFRRIDSPEAAPVDLLGAAGSPVAKRVGPVVGVLVVVLWLLRRRRRRS